MKKLLFSIAVAISVVACQKTTGDLELINPEEAFVVPGTGSNCSDIRGGTFPIPTSLSTDFFRLNSFVMRWKGNNYLVPAAIKITITSPNLTGSPVDCTISGTLLSDTFGGRTSFAASSYDPTIGYQRDIDMNDASYGPACAIGCGGLKRVGSSKNQSFSTTATIDFIGYSQDADGSNAKPVRATSRVRLNFF